MSEDRLDNIRMQLITNIFKNPDIVFNVDPEILDLIVALYEELHLMVMHEHYDYMWHWINKCTGSIQDTTIFDSTGKQLILLKEVLKHENRNNND